MSRRLYTSSKCYTDKYTTLYIVSSCIFSFFLQIPANVIAGCPISLTREFGLQVITVLKMARNFLLRKGCHINLNAIPILNLSDLNVTLLGVTVITYSLVVRFLIVKVFVRFLI